MMTETITPKSFDMSKREDWEAARRYIDTLAQSNSTRADKFFIDLCDSAGDDLGRLSNTIGLGYDPKTPRGARALVDAALSVSTRFPNRIDRGILFAYKLGRPEIAHVLIDAILVGTPGPRQLSNVEKFLVHYEADDKKAIEICHRILAHDPYRVGTLTHQAELASRVQSAHILSNVPPIARGVLASFEPEAYLNILDGGATASAVEKQFSNWPADLWRVVGFDPHPDADLSVDKTANVQMIRTALGQAPGTVMLYHTKIDGASSIYRPNLAYLENLVHGNGHRLSDQMAVISESEVAAIDLDTWRRTAGIPPFDFIKLNVQGAELQILKGAPDSLERCLGIQSEVAFAPVYEESPVFREMDAFLDAAGFTFFDIRKTTTSGRTSHRTVPFMGSRVGQFRWPSRQITEAHVLYLRDPFHPKEAGCARWQDPDIWLRLALISEMNGQVDFAMQLCETVLDRWPSHFEDQGAALTAALNTASDFYHDLNLRNS